MKINYYINFHYIAFIIFIEFNITFFILSECPKDFPIMKNECVSTYCSEAQFETGECTISNSIMKTKWINKIIKFENTKGDIYLNLFGQTKEKLIFGTTFSNNKERLFYGLNYGESYIFQDEPFIKINIPETENKNFTVGELSIITYLGYDYIVFIGNENINFEILKITDYSNGYNIVPLSNNLNEDTIVNGVSSSFSFYILEYNYYLYITLKLGESNSSNNFFSMNLYKSVLDENKLKLNLVFSYESETLKGKYFSCFVILNSYIIHCCHIKFLTIDNKIIYHVSMFKINYYSIEKYSDFVLGDQTTIYEEGQLYYFKGISMNKTFCIYSYFSGESHDIPTLEFKKFDSNFHYESNMFENITFVYLKDYFFNNDIKLNDIVKISITTFCFISTTKDKETLIVAYIHYYKSSIYISYNISIRYFTIELKNYYNMKILHGFKADYYKNLVLSLALDYCLANECDKYEINNLVGNAGLILFSYIDLRKKEIDFIENAFENNQEYLIINVTENMQIQNNIFGVMLQSISVGEMDFEIGINYTLPNADELLENTWIIYPDYGELIKIDFSNFIYDIITIEFCLEYFFIYPKKAQDFNLYVDKMNNDYGDSNEEESYFQHSSYILNANFYININYELNRECNDNNCNLCLGNETNYCFICKYGFKVIKDTNSFIGKKKYAKIY